MTEVIVCTEHDEDVPVDVVERHGSQIVREGFCPEDGGHEVSVVE